MEAQAQDMPSAGSNGNGAAPPTGDPPAADVPRETPPPLLFRVPPKLAADLTRTMLEQARLHDKAWRTMTTAEQEQWRDKVRTTAEDAIGAVVRLVAAQGFKAKSFTMKKNEDDGEHIKIALITPVEPDGDNTFLHDLVDHRGKPVVLVLADHEAYFEHHYASAAKARRAQGAQADIEDAIDETRPAIDSLSDDELATLMAGNPLRPSDRWAFTMEELTAERMRREDAAEEVSEAEHDAAVRGERPSMLGEEDIAELRALTDEQLAEGIAHSLTHDVDFECFDPGQLLAEQRRRFLPTDAAGNPIAADPVTGEIHETHAGAAPEEAQAGEGEGGADRPADPPSSEDRIAEALEDLGHVHAAPAKRPRKKKGDDAAPDDDGKSFVDELRDNGGDAHLAEQIARSQSERARRAREDAGV